jgi:hypothetical protein
MKKEMVSKTSDSYAVSIQLIYIKDFVAFSRSENFRISLFLSVSHRIITQATTHSFSLILI